MQKLVKNLLNLSEQINSAKEKDDYDLIIQLDKNRKIIIDKIFSIGINSLSEENIDTIKLIAEKNEKLISEISIATTKRIASANRKIKAIKGYSY